MEIGIAVRGKCSKPNRRIAVKMNINPWEQRKRVKGKCNERRENQPQMRK